MEGISQKAELFIATAVQGIFLFSIAYRLVLGPTQWVPWALPRGQTGRSVKLTVHLHLGSRLRIVEL
jgi:hypothetical protein